MNDLYFNEEVFGRPPRRILFWGNTVVLLILLAILVMAGFMAYPDTLQADITLSTRQSPIDIAATQASEIKEVLIADKQSVSAGQIVLVLHSLAAYEDVLAAEGALIRGERISTHLSMGELNTTYQDVVFKQRLKAHHSSTDVSGLKLSSTDKEVAKMLDLQGSMERQLAIQEKEFLNTERDYERSKKTLQEGLISQQESEKIENNWLAAKRQLEAYRNSIAQNSIRIEQLRSAKVDISKTQIDREQNDDSGLFQARKNLLSAIEEWKKRYLLHAPVSGLVSYSKPTLAGDMVRPDKPVFSVLPKFEEQKSLGLAKLPSVGSGKVEVGQRVRITLDNYPIDEYGMLEGKVEDIALKPDEKMWNLQVALPQQWETDRHKILPKQQNLTGRATIYTKNRTLLERLFGKVLERLNR